MKKYLYPLLVSIVVSLIGVQNAHAQLPPGATDTLFFETFDTVATAWKMTRSNIPSNRVDLFELDTNLTKDMSYGSATDTTASRTTSYITSPQISVTGYTSVGISFDHICYIDQFDAAIIEYSFDAGVTWRRLPEIFDDNGIDRFVYTGTNVYDFGIGPVANYKFSKASNALKWKLVPVDDSVFVFPRNTDAWENENFDLTYLLLRNPTPVDSMMIRFGLYDDPASSPGRTGLHRWWIDNVFVRGADCELVPPVLELKEPPRDYVQRYEGRVYQTPPYILDAKITDNKGVDTAYIVVEHRRDLGVFPVSDWQLIGLDTFPMERLPGNNFEGEIPDKILDIDPTQGTNDVMVGDSIYWKVETVDKSDCKNTVQDPPEGLSKFMVINDLPKSCSTQPVFDYPYIQTFDANVWSVGTQGILADNWNNISGDFHDWWVQSGPTLTPNTGPTESFPAGGKYLYVESTNFEDSTAFLLTPCFDFNESQLRNGLIKFYLNMNTNSLEDTVFVDIFDPTPILPEFPFGRFVNNVIPPVTGFKGDNWIPFEFSSFPFRNTVTQMRFRGKPGTNSGFGDMALDSFKIVPADTIDLRLNPVSLAPFSPEGALDNVVVNVQNLGIRTATEIRFHYEVLVDGNVVSASTGPGDLWVGALEPGESMDITTNLTYLVPRAKDGFQLKAWLVYNGDNVPGNDTSFSRSIGLSSHFMGFCGYRENFDTDTLWTTFIEDGNLTNKWELGTPNYRATATVITPPNAWDILLDRPYTGTGITRTLISPFIDMTGADSVIMSFLNNRSLAKTKDGIWIEYSFDRGLSWKLLLMLPSEDPLQKRWYNSNLSSGSLGGTSVLAGRTVCDPKTWRGGWLESESLIPRKFYNETEVLFRFNFFAEDDDDGDDGFSMDNFLVYDADSLDVEPQFSLYPNSDCDLSPAQKFKTVIKNRGLYDFDKFDIEYRVTHVESGFLQSKTETIERLIPTRDTIHVTSDPTFDMFSRYGDYRVEIITKLVEDGCEKNDTLFRTIENIQGCSLQFVINQRKLNFQSVTRRCDSSIWEFNYFNNGRNYKVKKAYNDTDFGIGFDLSGPIEDLFVCIKDSSLVRFNLNDIDTLVESFSFVAYNGKNDTIISEPQIVKGGPDSPVQIFEWNCPPQRSVSPIAIKLDLDSNQLPTAKTYETDVVIRNTGLDSINSLDVRLTVGKYDTIDRSFTLIPPLRFNKTTTVSFGKVRIPTGPVTLCAITSNPNMLPDVYTVDDTFCRALVFMDTVNQDTGGLVGSILPVNPNDTSGTNYVGYCDNFEGGDSSLRWVSITSKAYKQFNTSFEKGVPRSPNMMGAASGDSAWVTNPDGDYPANDSSTLLSPFFYLEADSCYQVSFMHNYYISDLGANDGGHFQVTLDSGATWHTIGTHLGDTIGDGQYGWYNTRNILSIPDDSRHIASVPFDQPDVSKFSNGGWTGISNGWQLAINTIRPRDNDGDIIFNDGFVAFRWRFHSDGSVESDGWGIDDFCIGKVHYLNCYGVGIDENDLDKSKLFLGQNIPNPASNRTSIPYFLPKSGEISFVVVNLLGQPVYEESGDRPYGEGMIDLDVSNLSKGVYYYWINFDGERMTNKMIISK